METTITRKQYVLNSRDKVLSGWSSSLLMNHPTKSSRSHHDYHGSLPITHSSGYLLRKVAGVLLD
jgi:hypothetical protein